jgi:cell division septation protein DedD
MSEAYQFAIGRSRALILAGCFATAALLLFFAGAITGTLYTASHQSPAQTVVPAPAAKPSESPAKAPVPAAGSSAPVAGRAASDEVSGAGSAANAAPSGSTTATSAATAAVAPATTASLNPEDSAAPSSGAASAPSTNPAAAPSTDATANAKAKPQPVAKANPAPATPSTAVMAPSYAIQLAVRVGSFTVKANAETLTQSLRDMGYQPTLSRSTDIRGRVWYVVRLGPYTKWNTASAVATRISVAENVTPVIGPMQ